MTRVPGISTSQDGSSSSRVVVMAALMVFLSILACGQTESAAPVAHTVVMKQMHFEPAQITIKPGDTVEWKNEDIFSHTVTANDQSFDSGLIAPGQTWRTTFTKETDVAYHCRPHPNMTASLVVTSGNTQSRMQSRGSGGGTPSLLFTPPTSPHEIHPILVNFTAALLPLALLSDILGRVFKRQSLHNAAWWIVLYEAAITPLTVAAGWWWKYSVASSLPPRLIMVHQWLGTSAAVIFIVLAVWRWRIHKRGVSPSLGYLAFALVAVLALVYQGSLGGAMVFGR